MCIGLSKYIETYFPGNVSVQFSPMKIKLFGVFLSLTLDTDEACCAWICK